MRCLWHSPTEAAPVPVPTGAAGDERAPAAAGWGAAGWGAAG
jgi:hypothetical protein